MVYVVKLNRYFEMWNYVAELNFKLALMLLNDGR